MELKRVLALLITALVTAGSSWAQTQVRGAAQTAPFATGKVYSFDKIADGVYYAFGRTPTMMRAGSNDPIIVNDNGVMVVDAGMTPGAARALLDDLKLITDKPVRWVVNTHFHYDHTGGNSVFGPEVDIIAQDTVRKNLLDPEVLHHEPYTGAVKRAEERVESIKKQLADGTNEGHQDLLKEQLAAAESDVEQLKVLKFRPPDITYSSSMTFHSGEHEVRLLFFGGGHTEGDTVVYLPKERIVCTGDMLEGTPNGPFVPYLGDGVFDKWVASLEDLKKLDFDTILPAHGAPFHQRSYIDEVQTYLRDFVTQITELHKQGLSADEAAKKVDLTKDKGDFLNLKGPGADIRGVRHMYQWLDDQQGAK